LQEKQQNISSKKSILKPTVKQGIPDI